MSRRASGPPRGAALVFVDIDHTLLDASGTLPDVNRRAIAAARRRGATIVLATARSYAGARSVHAALDLDTPLVVGNGTYVAAASGATLARTPLGSERLDAAFDALAPLGDPIALRTDQAVYLEVETFDPTGTPYADEPHARFRRDDPSTHPDPDAVLRVAAWGDRAEYAATKIAWTNLALRASYYPGHGGTPSAVAVSSIQATKGHAATWVRAHLGLDDVPTYAIGDNLDDIPMFELGASAAPASARDEVKGVADWVGPSCDDGAVAAMLEHFGIVDGATAAAGA